MHKFKRGDMVRRLNHAHASLSVGGIGTVKEVMAGGIRLYEDARHYPTFLHQSDNLELYVAAAAPEINQHVPSARKDDSGKLDMNLLDDMPRALKAVVEVMQWAIVDKQPVPYKRGSWLGVEPDRYRAAVKRHERAAAEQATPDVPARLQRDAETNLLHLAHTACSALMALENVLREVERAP